MWKMILAREPGDATALEALASLQGQRVMGIDRIRRGPRPESPPSDASLESGPMHGTPSADDDGISEIPLEIGREPDRVQPGSEMDALAAAPLFARLSGEALQRLVAEVELIEASAGDILYREGDAADTMFIVVDGRVHLYAGASPRHAIAELDAGEVLGVIGLVANEPRPIRAVAAEPCHLLVLHRRSLPALLRELDGLREALLDLARQRLLAAVMATDALFADLPADARDGLVAKFRFLQVRAGSRLMEAGRPCQHLFIVMTGRFELQAIDGATTTLHVGDVAGAESFLTSAPSSASMTATKGGFVLALHRDAYAAFAADLPSARRDPTARAVVP
jgi:CRP-like cAMP-binding protein